MALNCSNGSRQSLHTHSDLHEADPNRLLSRVRRLLQRGQRVASGTTTGASCARRGPGGATPYAVSLACPSGVTQSLVQAGASTRSEEHTSELQSLMRISYAVFCLKKKKR